MCVLLTCYYGGLSNGKGTTQSLFIYTVLRLRDKVIMVYHSLLKLKERVCGSQVSVLDKMRSTRVH